MMKDCVWELIEKAHEQVDAFAEKVYVKPHTRKTKQGVKPVKGYNDKRQPRQRRESQAARIAAMQAYVDSRTARGYKYGPGKPDFHGTAASNVKSIQKLGLLVHHTGFKMTGKKSAGIYVTDQKQVAVRVGIIAAVLKNETKFAVITLHEPNQVPYPDPEGQFIGTVFKKDISPDHIIKIEKFRIKPEYVRKITNGGKLKNWFKIDQNIMGMGGPSKSWYVATKGRYGYAVMVGQDNIDAIEGFKRNG